MASPGGQRTASFHEFVRVNVPEAGARLLEIGCGRGELALTLAADGYAVTAIDPAAPDGPLFRRVSLEDFSAEEPFDVVVASVALHHILDPADAAARIAALLRPVGLLVFEEFAKERLTGPTARWYYHQRSALAAVGREDAAVSASFDGWQESWTQEHSDIHSLAELRSELERHFVERYFEWTPYLYSYALDDSLEAGERALIESGEIEATGCRYLGERKL